MPATTVVSTRYHRAARDGLFDMVKQASSKDANQKDDLGMTPTMWAAFSGHSQVLRLLVSKGGALNKSDMLGNTPLHLAAANANTKCVAFICAMGADVWSLNIDRRTPRDMAAAHPKGESSLRLLDATMARELALDPKRCEHKRQRGKERSEKKLLAFQRITDEVKRQQLEERRSLLERSAHSAFDDATSLHSSSVSTSNSSLWAAVRNAGNSNKRRASAESNVSSVARSFNFGVGSVGTDGSRTIRPISGLAPSTEVLFSGLLGSRRASAQSTGSSMTTDSVTDAFDLAQRNQIGMVSVIASDSDTETDEEVFHPERRRSSLFNRPGFGTVAFRHSLTGMESADSNWAFKIPVGDVTDSAGKDESSTTDSQFDYDEEKSPLVSFLVAWGLGHLAPLLAPTFKDDLEALLLANEDDLQIAGLMTGPRKKLLRAIALRNEEIEERSVPVDTRL